MARSGEDSLAPLGSGVVDSLLAAGAAVIVTVGGVIFLSTILANERFMRPPTSVSPAGSCERRFRRIANHWVEGHSLLVFGSVKIDPSVLESFKFERIFSLPR